MKSFVSMLDHIKKIQETSNHGERAIQILEAFTDIFPVLDAYLHRYSPFNNLTEGMISYTSEGMNYIRGIKEDVRTMPGVYAAIQERRAKYYAGMDHLKYLSSKYIISTKGSSLLVVPIFHQSVVFGYIGSLTFIEGVAFSDDDLTMLTRFGGLVGEAIISNNMNNDDTLSKRELEVMKYIAEGKSNKEISTLLEISDLTVKQYVKTASIKLGAQNRTHAVTELFRRGLYY